MPGAFVRSLDRGLAVVRAFSAAAPDLTLSEVAARTGLTRATARRLLLTLVDLGYVGRDGRIFHLRPHVLDLGYPTMSSLSLPEITHPDLARLSDTVHESASMAVLDCDDVVYIDRVSVRRIMAAGIQIGSRQPAYLSSHGRVLLSALEPDTLDVYLRRVRLELRTARTVTSVDQLREDIEQVRTQGWSLVDQEIEEGVTSLAAPIRGRSGEILASVNVATHSSRREAGDLREQGLGPLMQVAAAMEKDLYLAGFRRPAQARAGRA